MNFFKLIFLILASTSPLLADINDDLIQAAKCGNLEQVENCLSQGAEIDAKNDYSLTPLILAASEGHLPVVQYLIEHRAEVNARSYNYGSTALMLAAENGHFPVVQYLVEQGAEVNAKNDYGWTALIWAARYGHLSVVQYLVEHRAEVNARTNYGSTSLMRAAYKGYLTVVQYLV